MEITLTGVTVESIPPFVITCEVMDGRQALELVQRISSYGVDVKLTREGVQRSRHVPVPTPATAAPDTATPPHDAPPTNKSPIQVTKVSLPPAVSTTGPKSRKSYVRHKPVADDRRWLAGLRRKQLKNVLPESTLARLATAGLDGNARIGSLGRYLQANGNIPEDIVGFGLTSAKPLRSALANIDYQFEDYARRRIAGKIQLLDNVVSGY